MTFKAPPPPPDFERSSPPFQPAPHPQPCPCPHLLLGDLNLDDGLGPFGVLVAAGEEVPNHELVDALLVAPQAVAGVLGGVDGGVGLVALPALARRRPVRQDARGKICKRHIASDQRQVGRVKADETDWNGRENLCF